MKSLEDKNIPATVDTMNRIYDIVLNMNSLNSKPSDGIVQDFNLYRCKIVNWIGERSLKKIVLT